MNTTFDRPARLATGPALGRPGRPVWMTATALIAALLIPLILWMTRSRTPHSLDDVQLVGARGPACVRLIIAADVSGSMQNYAAARTSALGEIRLWAKRNLRPDDEIGVLEFAGNAVWLNEPARVDGAPGAATGVLNPTGTAFPPILDLVGALPASRCDTSLTFLSDALMDGLPADPGSARLALRRPGVHDVSLLVPGSGIPVNGGWAHLYPEAPPVTFDGTNAGATGLAFGRVVAAITHQQLKHV